MEPSSLEQIQRAVGDRYAIEGLAGRGGMGAVYRGRHRKLGSPVAVKVLPVTAEPGSAELARFEREARLAASLPHPHIVAVFELQVVDDLAYFIMPFVEGVTLAKHLAEQGRMDAAAVLTLLREVGSALAFAHGRDVIHRDVKPANILREQATGRWLVADFGVARAVSADRDITRTGAVIGTPAYMAPEQAAGAADVDGRADLYALAAVACEALTGVRTDTLRDAADNEVLLRAARPDVSRAMARALCAGLALDRDHRPARVREWLAGVEAAGGRRGSGAVTVASGDRRVRFTVAGAVVVAALGVAAFLALRPGPAAVLTRAVAVVPASLDGRAADPALEERLALAFEDQLRWLEEYRVYGAAAVARAIADRFGDGPRPWDAVARFLTERFGISELLVFNASSDEGRRVYIGVQVRRAPAGRTERADSAAGPLDSLPALVSRLVTETFARQLARERTGWNQVVPAGPEAQAAWFAADGAFRSGGYDRAVEHYETVLARDSTFAPAHFRRMLCEVLRLRPTQAADAVRGALDAARRYGAGLDPTTTELLEAYALVVEQGNLERAHELLLGIVDRRPGAVDAWFLLGYLRFLFGPLFGVPVELARYPLEQAHALNPGFAAPIAQLAHLATLEDDGPAARDYFRRYLVIDSTSAWAGLIRLVDSLLYRGDRAALAAAASFADRSPVLLDLLALGGRRLEPRESSRIIPRRAVAALLERATTAADRAVAFRMQLSGLLAEGRLDAAAAAWRAGRRERIPAEELDLWAVLAGVIGMPDLATPDEARAAAGRLAARADDPTALWLAARWYGHGDAASSAPAAAALRRLAAAPGGGPLAASLLMDLEAHGRLAAGDTAGAVSRWRDASGRYAVDAVLFGAVGSLWPLRLAWARAALAQGDHDGVVAVTASFDQPAGLHDRAVWWLVLPLRARALEASGDALAARALRERLVRVLADAEGDAARVRDALRDGTAS